MWGYLTLGIVIGVAFTVIAILIFAMLDVASKADEPVPTPGLTRVRARARAQADAHAGAMIC